MFSFTITRENLKQVYQANETFINEMIQVEAIDRSLQRAKLKGKLFKSRTITPKRIYGGSNLLLSAFIYTYLPYITPILGTTIPVLGALAAALTGVLNLTEAKIIRQMEFIKEAGPYQGKLLVKYAETPLTTREVIVDPKHIMEVASLDHDTAGNGDNTTQHLVQISQYSDKATGEE